MSGCCFFIIVIIIIVSILIFYALHLLYVKLKKLTSEEVRASDDDVKENNAVREEVHADNVSAAKDNTDCVVNKIIFSIFRDNPSVRMCQNAEECEFFEFCNIQICRHLTNNAKIHNDKNTLKNVTYIHICSAVVVVFITRNDNVCTKEQEVSLEDINYINAYTSKFPELSIYTVFYDKENRKFIDFHDRPHEEYTIPLLQNQTTREILQHPRISHTPSAPTIVSTQRPDKGNFYYIAKQ
ncbi:hypothetical protein [Drosophila suzukii associated hytrosavirus 1]|nr:hypothetical protein [Drosophila suzukii associated hytrosavirus 1]